MLTIVIDCASGARLTQTLKYDTRHLGRAVQHARTLMRWADWEQPLHAVVHLGEHEHGPVVAVVYPVKEEE